jgi:hypothetical protein
MGKLLWKRAINYSYLGSVKQTEKQKKLLFWEETSKKNNLALRILRKIWKKTKTAI